MGELNLAVALSDFGGRIVHTLQEVSEGEACIRATRKGKTLFFVLPDLEAARKLMSEAGAIATSAIGLGWKLEAVDLGGEPH